LLGNIYSVSTLQNHVLQLESYRGTACFVLYIDSTDSYFMSYKMQVRISDSIQMDRTFPI
jgi:hypothetical protein